MGFSNVGFVFVFVFVFCRDVPLCEEAEDARYSASSSRANCRVPNPGEGEATGNVSRCVARGSGGGAAGVANVRKS